MLTGADCVVDSMKELLYWGLALWCVDCCSEGKHAVCLMCRAPCYCFFAVDEGMGPRGFWETRKICPPSLTHNSYCRKEDVSCFRNQTVSIRASTRRAQR